MYSKQHQPNHRSFTSAHTTAKNPFAPSKFVVQTKQAEREPVSAEEYERIRTSEPQYHDSSKFTYRPTLTVPRVQPKLKIGEVGDKYEQEADQVAQEVVQRIHAPEPPSVSTKEKQDDQQIKLKPLASRIQRQESEEETPIKAEEEQGQANTSTNTIMKSPIDSLIQRKNNRKLTQTRFFQPRLRRRPTHHRIPGASLWAKDKKGNDLPPSLEDISQGSVKNCFLFAAMAAIVNKDPQLIVKIIHDNGNGTYTVTFMGLSTSRNPVRQTVTLDFPIGRHGNVRRNALWPLVIEKAYAQQKGGIDVLDKGGNSGETIRDLTDKKLRTFNPQQKPADYILNELVKAKKNKEMITVSTIDLKDASQKVVAIYQNSRGLAPNHAYSVTDIDISRKRIKLFNPWGSDHPNLDGWVDMKTLRNFFDEVRING
ncbi:MAG TPA: C2 family cysteine protease [Nostocaceae cyanobacterium]|nr:C2 family cysteine protease [Nostocaceae cyanobacterium]